MAITNQGAKNSLPASQLPAGYAKPNVAGFTDHQYTRTLELTIPKADVEDADPATTMANIFNDAASGINKQIVDIIAADYLATATVTTFGDLVALRNNYQSMKGDSPALTDAAAAYIATVNLYVKAL